MTTDFQAALDNCDREPVHIPGQIQPFGSLLAFDPESLVIQHYSANAYDYCDGSPNELAGATLDDVFDNRELLHSIRGSLGLPTIRQQREPLGLAQVAGRQVAPGLHISDSIAVLELEDHAGPPERAGTAITQVRSMLANLVTDQGSEKLLASAVKVLRSLTGFDRVMGYRFLEDGSGEVAAEAAAPGLIPFLGLRYPAADIPAQVRKIAVRMPIRLISDIEAAPIDVVSPDSTDLDMTFCHLRSVSPIHIEYLQNMGIRATMNLSIIVRGELWGLFAFHHTRPIRLPSDRRGVAELFGQLFSMQLQQELEKQVLARRRRANSLLLSMRQQTEEQSLHVALGRYSDELLQMFHAHGLAVVQGDSIQTVGSCPGNEGITAVAGAVSDELLASDSLISLAALSHLPADEWNKSGGVLAIQVDDQPSWLMFFRNEVIHEVRWGGMPEKKVSFGPNGPRLHPRSSFAEYKENVAGRCEPWTHTDISAVTELRAAMLELMYRNALHDSADSKKQKEYQDLLIAELNHRVKNILALVQAIARQSKTSSTSLQSFVQSFESRIAALISAHDLIGGSGIQWVSLERMIRGEIGAYLNSGHNVKLTGPSVALRSDVAPTMSLVFHELTSNAVKYGALSQSTGSLSVDWQAEGGGLQIRWREERDERIKPPDSRGFGLRLIERAVPHECQGEAHLAFEEKGLSARFWLPRDVFELTPEDAVRRKRRKVAAEQPAPQIPLKLALVVEDNMVLALETERMLTAAGCEQIETTARVEEARQLIDRTTIDLAILDINLGGESSFELAEELRNRGIPFLFATGYSSRFDIPAALRSVPVLTKPITETRLCDAIRQVKGID